MRDLTLLISHPDDEAIFLWPFLDRVKRIVCASNDAFNPDRKWCAERGQCLAEVGKLLVCEIVCHSNSSEFYRTETRNGSLKLLASDLMEALRPAEIIATHNAWGEYGNLDHILCYNIARTVQAQSGCKVLVTDIAQEINWLPVRPWSQSDICVDKTGKPDPLETEDAYRFQIDRPLYDRIKAIYDARGCWTWAREPIPACRVYSL